MLWEVEKPRGHGPGTTIASAEEGAQDSLTFCGDLVEVRAQRSLARGRWFFGVPTVWGILRLVSPCEEESGNVLSPAGSLTGQTPSLEVSRSSSQAAPRGGALRATLWSPASCD